MSSLLFIPEYHFGQIYVIQEFISGACGLYINTLLGILVLPPLPFLSPNNIFESVRSERLKTNSTEFFVKNEFSQKLSDAFSC